MCMEIDKTSDVSSTNAEARSKHKADLLAWGKESKDTHAQTKPRLSGTTSMRIACFCAKMQCFCRSTGNGCQVCLDAVKNGIPIDMDCNERACLCLVCQCSCAVVFHCDQRFKLALDERKKKLQAATSTTPADQNPLTEVNTWFNGTFQNAQLLAVADDGTDIANNAWGIAANIKSLATDLLHWPAILVCTSRCRHH